MPDQFGGVEIEDEWGGIALEEESTPPEERPLLSEPSVEAPRPAFVGDEIPDIGGGIPPRPTEAQWEQARKQSRLGEEIAGTMAEAQIVGNAERAINLAQEGIVSPKVAEMALAIGAPTMPPGVRRSLAEAGSGLTSPVNAGLMLATGVGSAIPKIGGAVARGVAGGFAADIAQHMPELGTAAGEAVGAGTPEEQQKAIADIGVSALMGGLAAGGVMHRAAIPPRIIETIAKADAIGLKRAAQAYADTVKQSQRAAATTAVETKPTEVTSARAEPITESVSQPEIRPRVGEDAPLRQQGQAAEAQPQETPPLPREPARAQVGEEGQVLLIDRVAAMTPEQFVEAARTGELKGNVTGPAIAAGKAMATPEGIARLRELEAAAESEWAAFRAAKNVNALSGAGAKKGFFTEAIEGATGAIEFKKSDPARYRELMETGKPSAPAAKLFRIAEMSREELSKTGTIQVEELATQAGPGALPELLRLRDATEAQRLAAEKTMSADSPESIYAHDELGQKVQLFNEAIKQIEGRPNAKPIPAGQASVVELRVGADVPAPDAAAKARAGDVVVAQPTVTEVSKPAPIDTPAPQKPISEKGGVANAQKEKAGEIRGEGPLTQPLPEPAGPKAGGEQPTPAASQASGKTGPLTKDAAQFGIQDWLEQSELPHSPQLAEQLLASNNPRQTLKEAFAGGSFRPKTQAEFQMAVDTLVPLVERTKARVEQVVRAENAPPAKVGPGMGGALKSEKPDPRAQLAQLTDSIATLAAEGKTRPAEAFSLGETLSKAKDSAAAALDGLKAAGSYMKLKLEGKPITTEYKGVLGDRHLALSESSVNARKWMKNALKALPDPKVREAISNWVDAGGDSATLTKAAGETKARYREGYERAQNLTPEERTVAENLKNYFDSRLQEAIDAGVLEDGIENYIHRIYEQESPWKKGVIQELRSGLFTGRPALAKQRVFEYDFEAEKADKRPIKDFAKRVLAYDLSLNKAIADRQAVKAMMEIKMSDGRPMIDVGGGGKVIENAAGEPQATLINRSQKTIDPNDPKADRGDFRPYDHPALRKWKWATEDTAGKPVFVQGDVLIHPEAIKDIQTLLGRSAIRQNPVGRAALGVSSTIKQTMLDLSGFHPVQIAVHGTEHRTFAPVKEIDFTNPDVRGLIRGGAAVGETSGHAAFSEGVSGAGSSLTKHIPWVGQRLQAYNSWLFEDYIPRLKVGMGLHALERNRARFKDLSPDQLYELTANQMNAAFGEQNYTMLGRNKTTQDALRLALLAPDFLEARSRFVAQAFTKYGAEQRQALLLGAATMYITARLINKMLDDEYHFEPKNAFNVVYGGKSYGLRTVQGDLVHAVTEPGKFINHRLNPVYGKPALEFVTGRDYFGRKRTTGEQLKDFAQTPIPIGVRGAFQKQEQTLLESFLNSFGFVTKRDSPSSDISQLAQKWKEKNKISTGPGEFVYDAEKDPYRPIKLAAERDDEAGVRSEVTKAMNEGITRSRILDHFKLSEAHNFAGSAANERKFVESLTEDEKKIYADAKAERKRIRELVRRVMPPTPNPNP